MSLIPENDKPVSLFRTHNAPPIRRLFLSQMTDDSDTELRNETDTFRVFLRIKPNPRLHSQDNTIRIVNSTKLICKPPITSKYKKAERVEYTFSSIFGPETNQQEIFLESVVPCIEDLLNCRNSLIFAYGTTNAGKTYTVQGSITDPGLIPRTLHTVFANVRPDRQVAYAPFMAKNILKLDRERSQEEMYFKEEILRLHNNIPKYLKTMSGTNASYSEYSQFVQILEESYVELKTNMPLCSIWISFVELYNETIYDLLEYPSQARKPLKLSADKHDNFYVKGLKHVCVHSAEEAYTIYRFGKKNLNVACTKMNEKSSRSHCIFTVKLINYQQQTLSNLSICDLAGTERQAKAQNVGIRLKESGIINGSLFQLNRCLRAIRENQSRSVCQLIPYRHSNLTKLFHSAFDDRRDEKIVMIVNVNPSPELYDETQQVLKMCAIASKIKNKPIITKMLRQSTRFTTYVYGNDTNSLNDDDQQYENEFSDCEEDLMEAASPELQKELNRLKEQLVLKEKENNNLQFRLKELNQIYKNTQDVFNVHMDSIKEQEESYERRLKLQKDYYESKLVELRKHSNQESYSENDLKKELLAKDLLIEKLQLQVTKKNDNRNSFSSELQSDLNEKNNKIAELNSLLEEGKAEFIALAEELKSSLQKLTDVESQLQEKNYFVEGLEQELANKQNKIEALEERIENLEETLYENTIEHERILANLEKQRNESKEENNELTQELNKTKEELSNTRERLNNTKQELNNMKNEMNTIMDQQSALHNSTIASEKFRENIEKQLNQMKNKNKELKEELHNTREELNNTKEELNNTKEELINTKKELNDSEAKMNKILEQQSVIHDYSVASERFREDIAKQLNETKHKNEELTEELNKAMKELIKTKEELNVIKINQEVLCESNIEIEKKRLQLEEQCNDEINCKNKLLNELNQVKEELNQVKEELSKVKEERTEKEREIKETKRYNTRNNNNRTPLKQLDKEKFFINVTPKADNIKKTKKINTTESIGKSRTTKVKSNVINQEFDDSLELDVFRTTKVETEIVDKENNVGGKKKLFCTPSTQAENLISFDSLEKEKEDGCEYLDVGKKSDMATPAQTIKALRKKRIN